MKSTAVANSNVPLIKYWGKSDEKLFLPMNSSLSMTLDSLNTKTTVEFSGKYKKDIVIIDKKRVENEKKQKVIRHLNLIRKLGNCTLKTKIVSENNFPITSGLASSASGFAALTVSACDAVGLNLSKKELSIISRQGSGSSCRSIYGGYVEWIKGDRSEDSYAIQIANEKHLDMRDIVVIVSDTEKKISSRIGMKMTVETSPLYKTRLSTIEKNLSEIKKAILEKNFLKIGKIAELDCLMLHSTMLTTEPPLLYWRPETVKIIHEVIELRKQGLKTYFTIDAGPNVHVLTLPENKDEIIKRLCKIEGVKNIIHNKPGGNAKLIKKHLF